MSGGVANDGSEGGDFSVTNEKQQTTTTSGDATHYVGITLKIKYKLYFQLVAKCMLLATNIKAVRLLKRLQV